MTYLPTSRFLGIAMSLLLIPFIGSSAEDNPLFKDYHTACAESKDPVQSISLFNSSSKKAGPVAGKIKYVEYLDLNEALFNEVEKTQPNFIDLEVSFKNKEAILKMHKVSLGNYILLNSKDEELPANPRLVFYRGYIEGSPKSFVTASFLDDRVKVVYSNGRGNRTIYKEGQEYIMYADEDHLADKSFECNAEQLYGVLGNKKQDIGQTPNKSMTGACVEVYIEADNQSYVDNGSSIPNTETWVTSVFNDVGALYTASSIPTGISVIKVWDTADPYVSNTSTNAMLTSFKSQNATFNGALAHLFSTRSLGGGIAYLDVLCGTNPYAVSASMSSTYSTYPAYSWNVNVVAHEMGHNMGSNHTHDCVWNGNNTQIDDCGPEAGYGTGNGCYVSTSPILPTSGTIMSYCHLLNGFGGTSNVGIDFANGFGPLPGALMLNRFTTATCNTGACSTTGPTCSDGIQNGDEAGIDCGGTFCAACITCSDGIQNGSETGVDCGGPDCPACPTLPSNDDCAGAMDMSSFINLGNQVFTSANDLATAGAIAPVNQTFGTGCNTSSSWCNYNIHKDLWYKVTIPSGSVDFGVMTVDLLGSSYDTQLAIYTNCAGNEFAANDDYHGNSNNWTSKVSAAVLPGSTYYIQVDGYNNNATGNLTMNISYTPITGPVGYNAGVVSADTEAPDEFGYTHYVNIASGAAVLSVKKDGQDIGWLDIDNSFSVEVVSNAGSSNLGLNGCAAPYTNNADWYIMRRTWDLNPVSQPSSPMLVKAYYTSDDFNAVANNLTDVNLHTDLTHYKINSPGNEDITASGNSCHQTVSSGDYVEYEYGAGDYVYGLFNGSHYAEYSVNSFSGGGGGGGTSAQGALPIEIISFSAKSNGASNLIEWSTSSEINNDYQQIEKSSDGRSWEPLTRLKSDGDKQSRTDYEVEDAIPYLKTYYRLKSVDYDNYIQFSDIVSVSRGSVEVRSIAFPNPTQGAITVSSELFLENRNTIEIKLYDLQGKQYNINDYSKKFDGTNNLILNLKSLPNGIYPMVITKGDHQEILKITKF